MVLRSKPSSRNLIEQLAVGASARTGSPLKIDKDKGIIFRVKVLGRYSRNSHGMTEAENGTEYSPDCMRKNLPEYEERKVKTNHPPDRTNPGKERPVQDTFGVLRNARIESDESGDPAIWADLHCLTTHDMYPRVVEDVEKGLGVYGLSHNASAARERFDRATKRLVIEELSQVRSVDLVDKPATNRNLWESHTPMTKKTSCRELLEERMPTWSKGRQVWARHVLEDDVMAPAADAAVEMEDGGDEDDALWTGFTAAIGKILDKYKSGELDVKSATKSIGDYLKTHDKLTGSDEPAEKSTDEVEEACESGDADDKAKKKDGMQESEELNQLRGERKVRELCESLEFTPTQLQIEAIAGIKDSKRQRALAESFKGSTKPGHKTPRSGLPLPDPTKKPQQRNVQESEEQRKATVENDLATLRNG